MSEAEFARAIEQRLHFAGRRVLRVCDYADGKRGLYGLRAITRPSIDSTGADYLVLPGDGARVVLARSSSTVDDALREFGGPFFLELKDPMAKEKNRERRQIEQQEWIRWVEGAGR